MIAQNLEFTQYRNPLGSAPLKGPIFLYLTELKIESIDCAKELEIKKSNSKEKPVFFMFLDLVR